jgi:uncharacterized protein involved in exopolysaccharide biosynthesis
MIPSDSEVRGSRTASIGGPTPARGPSPHTEETDLFDYKLIRDYLGFVLGSLARHRWMVALLTLATVALAGGSLWALPKTYEVQARLLAQRNQVIGTLSNPGLARPYELDAPTRAARETVLRWDNLVALVEQTNLVESYLRTRSPAVRLRDKVIELVTRKRRPREDLVEILAFTLRKRLAVHVDSDVITFVVQWNDGETAYRLVDAAVQNFLEVRHASDLAILGDTISVLESHVAQVQQEIEDVTADIAALDKKTTVRAPKRVVAAPRPRIAHVAEGARLQGLLSAKRRAVADLDEARQRRIVEVQQQLAQQQMIYSDRHPTVIALKQQLETVSRPSPQLEAASGEARELEQEIARLAENAAALVPPPAAASVEDRQVATLADEDPKLLNLRGHLRLLFTRMWSMRDRIEAARMEMDTAQAAFKYRFSVITPPQMPKGPLKPNPVLAIVGGLVGGLASALLLALFADVRGGMILERWQIERQLELPVVAEIR